MINISRLMCGIQYYGDTLRYSNTSANQKNGTSKGFGPVVVWNITRTCNLKCKHCYSDSDNIRYENELTTKQAFSLIEELANFNVPVILFSGGEPLLRPDFFELINYAIKMNIRVTVSTNGTLITPEIASDLQKAGVSYVGISIDGIGENNDRFRGKKGAFDAALKGIQYCREKQQKVGLRFTINKHNYKEIEDIFKLIEEEHIPRACFYHLVYSGRGSKMIDEDISHEETRNILDKIIDYTKFSYSKGTYKEILTVDNHADGVYTYLKLLNNDPDQAEKALALLKLNGGNRSGIAISQIDWQGNVHPDQFTQNYLLGNVTRESFSDIWSNSKHPVLNGLRNRKILLKGRCSHCKWLNICNGNFRTRGEAYHGDFWAPDPACYLTDQEIGIN
ncbi:MAG: putative heme d1 biosynthesis radical SAM protein NirJ1 [Clostridiales bacterium]|nr:putative heme d1 biosynthesis radical SAM protein NirJ1 [Clostridiales bacterium]MCF8021929.1 putative heme d1 biosynthesis radical SAM protein NirJ1 [Clostridiales bacterium]